jgi:hypothetical protein
MTIAEAHIAFKVEADKNAVNIGMSGCPSFLPEEIDYWLYTAYLSKIATKFTGNNTIQTSFEGNTKRVADLEGLVRTDKGLTLPSETTNNRLTLNDFKSSIKYGSDTQDKRMYFIQGTLHFGSKLANVKLISHENALRFLETYNNKPWIEEPVAILEDNKLIVFVDRDLMTGPYTIDLTYLAYPRKINNQDITSTLDEIPEYMQYEVVKLAADMALENVESPRVQSHPQYVAQLAE